MDKKTLNLLAISAYLLIKRIELISFYEASGAKLTSDEDDYLRFDFDGGYSLIIKYDNEEKIKLVTSFNPKGNVNFKPSDEDVLKFIEMYGYGLDASKDFPHESNSELAILITSDDVYIGHVDTDTKSGTILPHSNTTIALKIIKEAISDVQKTIQDSLPELTAFQVRAIKKIVDDAVHDEKRRCHRIMQNATQVLLDEKIK